MDNGGLYGAIALPDGTWVRGRGLRHTRPPGPDPAFALYLGSARFRRSHDGELTWPREWIVWPDFLLPSDSRDAVEKIRLLYGRARDGQGVEVACGGGVGRTGTVIACLAVLAGLPADQAVAWVRATYHRRAIETPWQRRWVARFPPSPER